MEIKKEAFRLDLSSLDLHPVNEGDKEVSKEARYPNKFVHRRFYPMGIHKVPSLVPSRVDKEGPRMVRVQVKPQEDFRVSSAVSDSSGRTVRYESLSLPQEKILKLRSLCNATSAKQKVSRADLEGLIGLVTFSYSVIPLGWM